MFDRVLNTTLTTDSKFSNVLSGRCLNCRYTCICLSAKSVGKCVSKNRYLLSPDFASKNT